MAVRRRAAATEPLTHYGRRSRTYSGVGCSEQGYAEARVLVRWLYNLLCGYAGDRHGERSPDELLPLQGSGRQRGLVHARSLLAGVVPQERKAPRTHNSCIDTREKNL